MKAEPLPAIAAQRVDLRRISMRKLILSAVSALAMSASLAVPTHAEGTNRAEVEKIIKEYLLANPEILVEVQSASTAKREKEDKIARDKVLSESSADIFSASADAIIGNPKGDVTVVEFYDYNCGYCKRALTDMNAMVKADPNLRFVLKEYPILGEDSVKAHIVAQSFRKLMPEKYGEFHRELLGGGGRADEARAMQVAVALGAKEADVRKGMEDPAIGSLFDKNHQLAESLNITGTPSYVIKDDVVFGALGADVLTQKVENVRKCQKTACS
jgi:protein-disulfide isomerase